MSPSVLSRSLLVVTLAVLCLAGATAAGGAPASNILGDADCSGTVNPVDSLVVLRDDSGLAQAPCAQLADVQCDGDIDPIDSLLILRFDAGLSVTQEQDCPAIGEPIDQTAPPTSETLIADALTNGDITYEQSLLYRAYALFADPRLPAEYQSIVIDWEAGSGLFAEIEDAQSSLSAGLLADLAPFLARPNEPQSIHYDTPEAGVSAAGPNRAWQTTLVPGTNARVWALGAPGVQNKYVGLVSTVWSHFLNVFIYPNPDQANIPNAVVNPDDAIDFYFVNTGIDPRYTLCETNPDPDLCLTASDYGMSRSAGPYVGDTSSGYLIVNAGRIGADPLADDNLVDTIAHELAHVSQNAYDRHETSWLKESTATWVAYRIMKDLGRTPKYAYDMAESQYQFLNKPLDAAGRTVPNAGYRAWLFFQHAAMEAGDSIVSDVWEEAAAHGVQGINAVDSAFPMDDHFDDFTVRNWNEKPPVVEPYKDAPDATFPSALHPPIDASHFFLGPADLTLNLPVEPLSARYYHYTIGPSVRHVIFENNLVNTEHAHVWLLKKIEGDWKPPEDMAGAPVETWCRDAETGGQHLEDLQEVVVVVSYSALTGPALNHPSPRIIGDQFACTPVTGTVSTSLHVVDDNTDVTYTSGVVNVKFDPRAVQDEPGDVRYDLSSESDDVHWVGSGTIGGCPAEGNSTVSFSGAPYTGLEYNAGYLNVVGPGDFHSVIIAAFDPGATLTVTCPGDPPTVSESGFDAAYLLHIIMEPNEDDGPDAVFAGDCTTTFGNETYHFTWNLRGSGAVAADLPQSQPAATTHCVGLP
jgi:hypothetical protein